MSFHFWNEWPRPNLDPAAFVEHLHLAPLKLDFFLDQSAVQDPAPKKSRAPTGEKWKGLFADRCEELGSDTCPLSVSLGV